MSEYLEAVRKAVLAVFGHRLSDDPDRAREIVLRATYTGQSDPAQHWPTAAVIIYRGSTDLPDGDALDEWQEVDEELIRMGVQRVYNIPVNVDVIAFVYDEESGLQEPKPRRNLAETPYMKLVR